MSASDLFDLSDDQLRDRASIKWGTMPADVLPAWVAEMDVQLSPAITQRLQRALDAHDAGYPGDISGLQSAFVGFATEQWDWAPRAEDVTVHVDVATASARVMNQLAGPDRRVLMMPPVYNNFYTWAEHAGVQPVEVPLLDVSGGGRMDLDGIRAALAAGTRVILLCNPHNPLGRVFTRGELADLAVIAAEFGATVISDEIHAPLVHPGVEFVPYLTVSDAARATGIGVHAASKSWNIAGLKCGLLIRHPDGPWPREIDPEITRLEAGHWGVLAAEAAYRDGTEWLEQVREHFAAQSDLMRHLVQKHLPRAGYCAPQASFLAWLDMRAYDLGDPAAFFRDHARVELAPGQIYGDAGAGHVRLNMGTSAERLDRIVAAMGDALRHQD